MAEIATLVYSIIKDVGLCLWKFVSSPVVKVCNLKDNLDSLNVAMVQLKEAYEDVNRMLELEEKPQMQPTTQVSGWLKQVLELEKDVMRILEDGKNQDQNKCLGGFCPKNCLSSYKLEEITSKKLEEVKELQGKRSIFNAVVQMVHVPVQKILTDETVGLNSMLQNVWGYIEDQNSRTIGLYGTGGVGKSTLLRSINNEFLKVRHDFNEVILVVVTKEPKVDMVQKTIMDKLGLTRDIGSPDSDQINAQKICNKLHGKKFLLLLDDIWQKLDLKHVGVPLPDDQNQSKVVITTRSREVCGLMGADPQIEVQCLAPEEALYLFRMKVGEAILNSDPEISELAKDMAAKCNGLPLALITVGGTMASRYRQHEWVSALNILRNTPSQFQGMGDVLELLKFGYEKLPSSYHKSCFLYCCLFPENHEIRKEELIEYWIGEGFLDEFGEDANINGDLRPKGELIIEDLKRACLLRSGESEEFIRMHGMVRDMAWQECQQKIALLIKRDNEARGLNRWNKVERISLWDHSMQDLLSKVLHPPYSSIEDLLGNISQLPNLRTMICKDPLSKTLHATFFPLMSALRLLDLSNSSVLHELPTEIGQLINLEYLNLSDTAIPKLPPALQNLTKMRCLILNYTNLQKFPEAMISNFKFLEVFSKLEILQPIHPDGSVQYLLEEMERLQHIREICIAIHEATYSLQRLLESQKLLGCIRKLTVDDCDDLTSLVLSPSSLRKMEDLQLRSCYNLREVRITLGTEHFDKLSKVVIKGCRFLSDVRWLIYARRLQILELVFCESLGEIIGVELGVGEIEENMAKFPRLSVLRLVSLQSLERICRHALPFPSLIEIEVQDCPLLKKLPFDSRSARNNLKLISGDESWWESLDWDDEAIKPFFSSKFQKLRPDQIQKAWFEDFGSRH